METNKELKTYTDIGIDSGLTGITLARYVSYMKKRWGEQENERVKCLCGYAGEWAIRFSRGMEYNCSDCDGQRILKEMDIQKEF